MKKQILVLLGTYCLMGTNEVFSQPQCYLQLYPGDNSKIIFQFKADQSYDDVAIFVNFYNVGGKAVKLNRRFFLTSNDNKYLTPDGGVYSFVFSYTYKNVDHVELGNILDHATVLEFDKIRKPGDDSDPLDDDDGEARGTIVSAVKSSNPLGDIPPATTVIRPGINRNFRLLTFLVPKEHQSVLIHSTWHCDLSQSVQASEGDFWWSVDDAQHGAIIPQNGARFFVMWNCPRCYDTLGYRTIRGIDQSGLMTSAAIPIEHAPVGSIVAFITRENRYGFFKIDRYIRGRGIDLVYSSKIY